MGHEGAVDLDGVNAEFPEMESPEYPVPKSSNPHTDTHIAQRLKHLFDVIDLLDQTAFGNSTSRREGGKADR